MKAGAAPVVALVWLTAALTLPAASARAMTAEVMPPPPVVVAVALPGSQDFWLRCQKAMLEYARRNNQELRLVFGGDDQMKQNAQVRQLLAGSPDVLILAAHDALGAAAAVKSAQAAQKKVLALDRLILNADLDLYLAFDHEQAGKRQAEYLVNLVPQGPYVILSGPPNDYSAHLSLKGAMEVLGPLIESGRIQVLADGPIIGRRPERAGDLIRRLLDQGLQPAAVLAPDDAAAGEVARALKASGRMPAVAGQNGEPAAVLRLKTGEQVLTLVKNPAVLAVRALELAGRLAQEEDLTTVAETSIDNGLKDVPAVLLTALPVDRRNLEAALKEGLLRQDDI
jgi:D-xylose transport system substrate-binding protein